MSKFTNREFIIYTTIKNKNIEDIKSYYINELIELYKCNSYEIEEFGPMVKWWDTIHNVIAVKMILYYENDKIINFILKINMR